MARPFVLPRRSPFAFPGTLAGINPSHPATNYVVLSAIAASPGFINLVNGARATVNGTTALVIDSTIGVTWNDDNASFYPFTTPLPLAQATLAAIVRPATIGTNSIFDIATAFGIFWNAGTLKIGVPLAQFGTLTGFTAGNPYFIAASTRLNSTNIVVRDLSTGSVQTDQQSGAAVNYVNTTSRVGTVNTISFFNGKIAAVMCSGAFLGLPQLVAWAADPWSFWYPNTTPRFLLKTPAAVGTALVFSKQIVSIPLQTTFAGEVDLHS